LSWILIRGNIDDTACYRRLEKLVKDIITDLKTKSLPDFVEGILSLSREQSLINGKWETDGYTLQLCWGGPTLLLYTSGYISTSWGRDFIEARITDQEAVAILKELEEYLDLLGGD